MIAVFEQKRRLNSRRYMLDNDKIIVELKTIRKCNRYEVKLTNLGLDLHYQSDNIFVGKIIMGVFVALLIGLTLDIFITKWMDKGSLVACYSSLIILILFSYFREHQDDVYLVGGQTNLVFYRNIPNEAVMLQFIDTLQKQIKYCLKEKYVSWDNDMPDSDFLARINWLRDMGALSEKEYSEYKVDYELRRLIE